jgi:hypothetical protein
MKITASTTGRAGNFAKIKLVDAALMTEVGDLALSMIRRRTAAGLDVDERPFQPLSPGYAAQKLEALGSGRADLTVSGRMLNEMGRIAVTEKTVSIGFQGGGTGAHAPTGGTFIQRSRAVSGADKALFHNKTGAGKSQVKRKFFGLTATEKQTIAERVQRHISVQVTGGGS